MATLGRVAINFYEVPSAALTPELSDNYDERTALMSWRYFFGYVGGLGTAFLALRVFLQPTEKHPVGQLNPEGYAAYGMAGAILIFVSILISTWGTHDRIPYIRQAAVAHPRGAGVHFREMLETLSHKSVLSRGFALVTRPDGTLVRAAARLEAGDAVRLRFADGEAAAAITGQEASPAPTSIEAEAPRKKAKPDKPAQGSLF